MSAKELIDTVSIAITAVAAVVAAAAAVAIPIVIDKNSQRARENDNRIAQDARTIQLIDLLDDKISSLVFEKVVEDKKRSVDDSNKFSKGYIDAPGNEDVQKLVFRILNLYDLVCFGANRKIFSDEVVQGLRGDALKATFVQYHDYIEKYRQTNRFTGHAWSECDRCSQCASRALMTSSRS